MINLYEIKHNCLILSFFQPLGYLIHSFFVRDLNLKWGAKFVTKLNVFKKTISLNAHEQSGKIGSKK